MQRNIRHDAYDFTTGTGNDKASFEQFKKILFSNHTVHKDNALTVQSSDWYYEAEMETDDDSDEGEQDTYYVLDGDEEVVTEVPLTHKETIKL